MDKDGNLVPGLAAYRVMKEATKDIEGEMDDAWLKNLIKKYNASKEKKYLDETNPGYLYQGGHTKYDHSNYTINYAYFSRYMATGNEAMTLDYDFLKSAKSFYKEYKKAVLQAQMEDGSQKMTKARKKAIQKKVDQMKTPFTHKYIEGWVNILTYFEGLYWVFVMMLLFALAQTYAKNSVGGISQMTLSTIHGRKKDMIARWISGNLFTIVSYCLWLVVLIVPQALVATLHGWDASAQTLDYTLTWNMNVGTYTLVEFLDGLAGALVIANLVMLFSIKLKDTKLTCVMMAAAIFLLKVWRNSYGMLVAKTMYLNPLNFTNGEETSQILFVGNLPIEYFIAVILMACVYVIIMYLLIRKSYKKYRIV